LKKKKICNSKNRKQLSHHRTACVVGKNTNNMFSLRHLAFVFFLNQYPRIAAALDVALAFLDHQSLSESERKL
jgi:hypothetical protein